MSEPTMPVDSCGRYLGQAGSWEQIDENTLCFYNFTPADGINLPKGVLTIDYDEGYLYVQNHDTDVELARHDIPTFLSTIKR